MASTPGPLTPLEDNLKLLKEQLDILNEGLDSSGIEEDLAELASVQADGKHTFRFLEEDIEFQRALADGGPNPSVRVDRWATNCLDAFRKFRGIFTDDHFIDFPPPQITALLTKFFEQVCKENGKLYPSQSIMSLYRAFHRVIIKKQVARIQNTGIDEAMLSLKSFLVFSPVGVACVLAMGKSREARANLPRKKSAVISSVDEATILAHSCTAKTNARGLQKRACYYLLSRFCIRGGAELYSLHSADFQLGSDEHGRYIRFDERLSKNYKVSLQRYQEEHFRPPITEYTADIIETMDLLLFHLPATVPGGNKFLFYQSIDSPRTNAWYSTSRVSQKNLTKWLKLIHEECDLDSEGITNKSGRTTCVTRMAMEGVPANVGMLLTGHKNSGSYSRYDRTKEAQVRAAQKCVSAGAAFDSVAREETAKMKSRVVKGEGVQPARRADSDKNEARRGSSSYRSEETFSRRKAKSEGATTVANSYEEIGIRRQRTNGQTTEEFDAWADEVDWDEVDSNLVERGYSIGRQNVLNPVTCKILGGITNCNVHIHMSPGGIPGSINLGTLPGTVNVGPR